MIQKIQNLNTEISNEQIEIEWAHLFSIRNKLLEISDWTQLPDVFLSQESKKHWRIWRQKLRKINRKTFSDLKQATAAIDVIKKQMPKAILLDESSYNADLLDNEREFNKIIEKEKTVVIREELQQETFNEYLINALNKDQYEFKQYLLSFLHKSNTNIFLDSESLDSAQQKTKWFLSEQQIYSLDKKVKYLPDIRILNQRAEEALEFLSNKNPKIDDFPLIKLYTENFSLSNEETALTFLKQKKWYNVLLFESEKFLAVNSKKIDNAKNIDDLKIILEDIKNGY